MLSAAGAAVMGIDSNHAGRINGNAGVSCYDGRVSQHVVRPIPHDVKTVFLDRDGVLNEKMAEGSYVASSENLHILPGVPKAVARLNRIGLRAIVVSNQRGVALGRYTLADVEAVHSELQRRLKTSDAHVDAFYVCPHDSNDCKCRKPLPGLYEQAVADYPEVSAVTSVMIGDSLVDIEFGRRLGMSTILIEGHGAEERARTKEARALADWCFSSFPQAVDGLLEQMGRERSVRLWR
jgi:D-glycero-D-manno-heptose 1,7-bisphosphate phosphatase